MDLESISKQGNKISLLTLPLSDLDKTQTDDAILVQLPRDWTPSDLMNCTFVATPEQPVAFVSEDRACSFEVHRAEISNVMVLVPPLAVDISLKRSKVATTEDETAQLVRVGARLVKKGGEGASFLELRPKSLSRARLRTALPTWDPYEMGATTTITENNKTSNTTNSTNHQGTGRTVEDLALEFQCSQKEIQMGLAHWQAYATETGEHVLLSDQAKLECYGAIIGALAEVDDCDDYAAKGVTADSFVLQVEERMSAEERFPGCERVVRHLLGTLSIVNMKSTDGKVIRLDVAKVAVCVVRRLFLRQTSPWEETLLLSRWQSELPGVGETYKVDVSMLYGVAVCIPTENERYWKYLPLEALPVEPSVGIPELLALKPKWLLAELESYLDRWADGCLVGDLILRYTKTITEDINGVTMKFYVSKQ